MTRIPGWKDISTTKVTIIKNGVPEAPEPPEPDWAGIVRQIEDNLNDCRGVGWGACREEIQEEIRLVLQDIIRAGCGYPRA